MNDEAPGPGPQEPPGGFDHWIRPFFDDSGLWPILSVLVLSFCTLGAAIITTALIVWNPFALAALALALLVSADVVVRAFLKRTNRLLAGCVAGFWLGSAAITAVGIAFGIV